MELSSEKREKKIAEVTLVGSVVNLVLSVGKIAAGLFGRSAAMVTDGIHSLSDLFSDIILNSITNFNPKISIVNDRLPVCR